MIRLCNIFIITAEEDLEKKDYLGVNTGIASKSPKPNPFVKIFSFFQLDVCIKLARLFGSLFFNYIFKTYIFVYFKKVHGNWILSKRVQKFKNKNFYRLKQRDVWNFYSKCMIRIFTLFLPCGYYFFSCQRICMLLKRIRRKREWFLFYSRWKI